MHPKWYRLFAASAMLVSLSSACQSQLQPRLAKPDYTNAAGYSPASAAPTATPPDYSEWKTYTLSKVGLSLRYPPDWEAEGLQRFAGPGGFFEIEFQTYANTVFGSLQPVCVLEANLHKPDRYGQYPLILDWQGQAADLPGPFGNGCSILPSADAPATGEATLFTRSTSDPESDQVLVLRADADHFAALVTSLRLLGFPTPTASSGSYTSPLCSLSGPSQPVETQFAGLRLREYPIVDAACHPYNHFDSFQARVKGLALELAQRWQSTAEPHASEAQPLQLGQASLAWEFDQEHLSPPVGAPSQVNILRDQQNIYTLAVPRMDPSRGQALWAWNDHWLLEVEGVLVMDGEIQNPRLGYAEIFEWHLVNGQPFYFYRQADQFGMVYADQIFPQRYTELLHGPLCCDPAVYLPRSAPWGAQFYAQRDGVWWYGVVETP